MQDRLTAEAHILKGEVADVDPARLENWAKEASTRSQASLTERTRSTASSANLLAKSRRLDRGPNRDEDRSASVTGLAAVTTRLCMAENERAVDSAEAHIEF